MRGKEPMTDAKQGDKPDPKKPKPYTLRAGGVALLAQYLPTPHWYKDDAKQASTLVTAVAALDALPEVPDKPKPENGESREAFEARFTAWRTPACSFEWTDRQRETVKKCIAHHLKQAALPSDEDTLDTLRAVDLLPAVEEVVEPPKVEHYELCVGGVALLKEVLASASWYKEDSNQAKSILHAVTASLALPAVPERPRLGDDPKDFEARVDAWAEASLMFDWTDAQKDAAKRCTSFYVKQGAFIANDPVVALLRLLRLHDDE